ncbi:MAG: hemolysin family protein [Chitinophagaceae bacterium]|jgi:CBS domain containing-hemolysin-like protein|nr:hemolysin family protein [Chitinophagaceae bacterium]MCF8289686.1 hemolysin family protein [Chitinophagaceae bacterium]MCF8421965.1 hemolysin family protein [Chitinophagaceae bacterium]
MIFAIVASVILIGFFSGYEIGFVSANRLSLELKKKQGSRSGKIIAGFLEAPTQFIGTCLIGLNISLVVFGILFEELLHTHIWSRFGLGEGAILVGNTIVSTFVILFIGELVPKAMFKARAASLINTFAPLAQFFHILFKPLTVLLVNTAQWVLSNLFQVKMVYKKEAFTKVDLAHFIQQTNTHQEQQELNTDLFENALSLPDIKVRKCLVPRTEIVGVEIQTPLEEVKALFIETKLSKLIVYNDTLDNIVGYIHQLDLFKKPKDIKAIIHPILLVTESMNAADLINLFSKKRKSIAWVVDEFGGTAGIVTMEDVLEEIFGEINDEYDEQEFLEKKLSANEYLFSGRLELDYLYEKYGIDFAVDSAETLSGYLIHKHEAIPKVREVIHLSHFDAEILLVSDTRIEKVKLTIH